MSFKCTIMMDHRILAGQGGDMETEKMMNRHGGGQ